MKQSRFSEEQIIKILREAEKGGEPSANRFDEHPPPFPRHTGQSFPMFKHVGEGATEAAVRLDPPLLDLLRDPGAQFSQDRPTVLLMVAQALFIAPYLAYPDAPDTLQACKRRIAPHPELSLPNMQIDR